MMWMSTYLDRVEEGSPIKRIRFVHMFLSWIIMSGKYKHLELKLLDKNYKKRHKALFLF